MMYPARPQSTPVRSTTLLPDRSSVEARREALRLKYHAPVQNLDEALEEVRLVDLIQQRVEARLPGRIRNFHVSVTEDAVQLDGECNTFHTKQLAQHLAMGVLDYERILNNIDVRIPG